MKEAKLLGKAMAQDPDDSAEYGGKKKKRKYAPRFDADGNQVKVRCEAAASDHECSGASPSD